MARAVEVLEVKRVIPGLVIVRGQEAVLAALEFDREHCRSGDEYRVDPATESRDLEFQVEHAREAFELFLENADLVFPGASLRGFDVVLISSGERSQNSVGPSGRRTT